MTRTQPTLRVNGYSSGTPVGFIPITAHKHDTNSSHEINGSDKTADNDVFTHAKSLAANSKNIEIKLPVAAAKLESENKKKEDPKSHLYGKWEAYTKPDLNKFTRMCHEISAKEGVDEPKRSSFDEDERVHHPFQVSQAPMYVPLRVPHKTPSVRSLFYCFLFISIFLKIMAKFDILLMVENYIIKKYDWLKFSKKIKKTHCIVVYMNQSDIFL